MALIAAGTLLREGSTNDWMRPPGMQAVSGMASRSASCFTAHLARERQRVERTVVKSGLKLD